MIRRSGRSSALGRRNKTQKKPTLILNPKVRTFLTLELLLPVQNVDAKNVAAEPTTNRGHTLDQLLIQLKHPKSQVRRDALIGLRELSKDHFPLIGSRLGAVTEKLLQMLSENEDEVRNALLGLLSALIPLLDTPSVHSFFPLYLVYLEASLTSPYRSIRLFALEIVAVWLQFHPTAVATPLLPHLLPTFKISKSTADRTMIVRVLANILQQIPLAQSQPPPYAEVLETAIQSELSSLLDSSLNDRFALAPHTLAFYPHLQRKSIPS